MSGAGRVITGVDLSATSFRNSFKRLPSAVQAEARQAIRLLLDLDLDQAPARLHLHQLKQSRVASRLQPNTKVPAWTLHVTSNDAYKASFTLESGTAYLRLAGTHEAIDRNP